MPPNREDYLPRDPYLRKETLALTERIKKHLADLRKEEAKTKRKQFEDEIKRAS